MPYRRHYDKTYKNAPSVTPLPPVVARPYEPITPKIEAKYIPSVPTTPPVQIGSHSISVNLNPLPSKPEVPVAPAAKYPTTSLETIAVVEPTVSPKPLQPEPEPEPEPEIVNEKETLATPSEPIADHSDQSLSVLEVTSESTDPETETVTESTNIIVEAPETLSAVIHESTIFEEPKEEAHLDENTDQSILIDIKAKEHELAGSIMKISINKTDRIHGILKDLKKFQQVLKNNSEKNSFNLKQIMNSEKFNFEGKSQSFLALESFTSNIAELSSSANSSCKDIRLELTMDPSWATNSKSLTSNSVSSSFTKFSSMFPENYFNFSSQRDINDDLSDLANCLTSGKFPGKPSLLNSAPAATPSLVATPTATPLAATPTPTAIPVAEAKASATPAPSEEVVTKPALAEESEAPEIVEVAPEVLPNMAPPVSTVAPTAMATPTAVPTVVATPLIVATPSPTPTATPPKPSFAPKPSKAAVAGAEQKLSAGTIFHSKSATGVAEEHVSKKSKEMSESLKTLMKSAKIAGFTKNSNESNPKFDNLKLTAADKNISLFSVAKVEKLISELGAANTSNCKMASLTIVTKDSQTTVEHSGMSVAEKANDLLSGLSSQYFSNSALHNYHDDIKFLESCAKLGF